MKASKIKAKKPVRVAGGQGPGGMNMMRGEKAKDFKGTLRKLVRYIGKYKAAVVIVMIFAAASTVFAILGPRLLGQATTNIFTDIVGMVDGTKEGIDFTAIQRILVSLIILYGISSLFMYIQGIIMSRVSVRVTYNLRKDISEKINRLPLAYYDKKSYGEVLTYITNDVDVLSQTLNQSISQIISSVTMVIGILIMMFSMSWLMTLIALAIIPISLVFVVMVVKRSQKYFSAQQEYLGHVNGHVEEMYGSHLVVKAFNGEEESIKEFSGMNDELYDSAWKSQFLSGMMMPVMQFIGNLGYVAICILGGYLAVRGSLPVGDIQAFIQYVRQFTQPIMQIAQISNVLQQTMAAAERVFAFLDEPEESADAIAPASEANRKGQVTFDHARFGYNKDKIIIHDFSAEIQPGQKVAIVGPTGAGKTTIVKLLMRFYDLEGGAILVDGTNITEFTRSGLRGMFGMVLQDAWLESGSIRENIRYGRLTATDEEVKAAAKAAQVDHFVRTLPEGYDTLINEESSNVSQGQKQLLTIARAILADPKMLILDEATSSVDTRTEVLIQKAMDNLMTGRTSFVIAHRLSTIQNADVIFVMKDGDIVEQGSHAALLEKGGFYADLYMSQFEPEEEAAQA
ncbi:MAG TPA: multidrug ABC transporter ATP-binding protein [Clostridiales bacterium]|nr:multidrug ABC transporter ATP-binding protein [Clostridiales bacterium]